MIIDIKVKMKDGSEFRYNNQAEAIKAARVSAKLTQQDVADAIGANVETYRKYECGKRVPQNSTLDKIAKTLGVALEVLLCAGGD